VIELSGKLLIYADYTLKVLTFAFVST